MLHVHTIYSEEAVANKKKMKANNLFISKQFNSSSGHYGSNKDDDVMDPIDIHFRKNRLNNFPSFGIFSFSQCSQCTLYSSSSKLQHAFVFDSVLALCVCRSMSKWICFDSFLLLFAKYNTMRTQKIN